MRATHWGAFEFSFALVRSRLGAGDPWAAQRPCFSHAEPVPRRTQTMMPAIGLPLCRYLQLQSCLKHTDELGKQKDVAVELRPLGRIWRSARVRTAEGSALIRRQTKRKKLPLARNAQPLIRAFLIGHDAAGLHAHAFGDLNRAASFEHAAQRVEFPLGQRGAEPAQAREHHLRNAELALAANRIVMPRRFADQRRERFDQFDFARLEIPGVAFAIQVHGKPDIGGRLQQQREPVGHVGCGVARGAITVVRNVGAALPVQHERRARLVGRTAGDDLLIAVERVKEARVGIGDVAQKAPAAMIGDGNRARPVAEFVGEDCALCDRSRRAKHVQHFGGERVGVVATDGRNEAGDAREVELTCLPRSIEMPVTHVS